MARAAASSAKTIAVTSGKGGVGKSNIAVNLSICLTVRGLRTTLVDVDMGLANADLLMNLQPRYTLSHVLSGVRGINEIAIEGPCGLRFIPGASGLHELADLSEFERQHLIAQFHRLEANTDIIVLDCGAGLSRNVLSFALAADRVLVVTTPQPTALTDAYATIKALRREGVTGRVSLFVNMADSRAEALATYERIAAVARKFLDYSLAYDGYMLDDTAVELAVQARCPFVVRYPGSNASACIAAMAGEIARTFAGRQRRGGFLKRVAGLFV
jgi:flagellar biosynthesis protein FlhG